MVPPDSAEIQIFAGTDFTAQWNWVANGLGVDFTACSAAFSLRVVPTDAPLVTVVTGASPAGWIYLGTGATLDAGLVVLYLSAATTAALSCPVAHGDLVITMSDGSVREFLAIDAFVQGALFTGIPGPAGGMLAPAGPPGMSGPGRGKTISAADYNVQPGDSWLRADARANDVTFHLPAAGAGEGEPHTFLYRLGTHRVRFDSPSANIEDPTSPGNLIRVFELTALGTSASIAWDGAGLVWAPW